LRNIRAFRNFSTFHTSSLKIYCTQNCIIFWIYQCFFYRISFIVFQKNSYLVKIWACISSQVYQYLIRYEWKVQFSRNPIFQYFVSLKVKTQLRWLNSPDRSSVASLHPIWWIRENSDSFWIERNWLLQDWKASNKIFFFYLSILKNLMNPVIRKYNRVNARSSWLRFMFT
jgi:hypothetical protein